MKELLHLFYFAKNKNVLISYGILHCILIMKILFIYILTFFIYLIIMETFLYLLIFILSFILILKGGDFLVESSIWLSKKANIPSMVVGATIVALATTFPETSVSFFSGIKGAEELAVNTAIGSMVCNFALVLGFSFLIKPSRVNKTNFISKVGYFCFALLIMFLLGIDGSFGKFDACVLFVIFIVFLFLNFFSGKEELNFKNESIEDLPSWPKVILQFFISAFSIGFGANIMVSNVEELSAILGISEGLFGLFIISVGTNIPEFVTTLTAIKLNNADIGVGNIFGSSIIDASLLIAVTVFSSRQNKIPLPLGLLVLTVILLLLITIIIVLPILKKGKSNRLQGLFLVILFIIYTLMVGVVL